MCDYEKYEKNCEKIRKANGKLLEAFAEWMTEKGLSSTTIDKHIYNASFYINEFLLYEDAVEAKKGVSGIGMFLGYWFIKKAMWSSVASVKQNATSLKKFYQFMAEVGEIPEADYSWLKDEIKTGMPEWTATMARYDDPDIEDMDEVWGM